VRPKFLLNAHISPLVAEILAKQGIEAQVVAGSPLGDAPDEELLKAAAAQGRILVTYDTDTMPDHYRRLYEQGEKFPGVAYVKAKSIPQGDAPGLAKAIQRLSALIETGGDPLGVYFLA
jgi:predicted nuclease of predicted toxin-antitoxin system